jgi:hypothetical protein
MLTSLNTTKWVRNTLLFLRPVLLIYLGYVTTNLGIDGFDPSDFVPNAFVTGAMVLYLVNIATDYLQKLDYEKEVAITAAILSPIEPMITPPIEEPIIK